jgi:uncharacterized protein (DUF433 family)
MTLWDRNTVDAEMMNGQPCIRGMRLTVRRVVEAVALYPSKVKVLSEYPELDEEDIARALDSAARSVGDEILTESAASCEGFSSDRDYLGRL